ncbi:MAG: GNAT family N-acetyltransferase [Acidobacteria bacterium]|nr:GNAT family N-acetyltransferase [Acidobacteriota bacterium]
MSGLLRIRPLVESDLPLVGHFPPPEWNFSFQDLLRRHLGRSYFIPLVGECGGEVAAVGHGLSHGDTGWLGNIIVSEGHRRKGFGLALTSALMERLRHAGCRRQVLIATSMGEPLYARLGFRVTGRYTFFKAWRMDGPGAVPGVRPLCAGDEAELLRLDRQATGEDRAALLSGFLLGGFAHRLHPKGDLGGFYLPGLGAGLVVARDREAGEALLRFKHMDQEAGSVIPEDNREARDFLLGLGCLETGTAPRMELGTELAWRPGMVWSRGAGWCG